MAYAARKLLSVGVTLLLISLLVFGAFQILPGNPATIILGVDADPLQIRALEQKMGLDRPLMERYLGWIGSLFKGDLGESLRYQLPVSSMILKSLPVTVSLSVLSILITIFTAVPLSIFLARHNNGRIATFISALTQLGVSVPSFWVGMMLILLFSVTLRWFPSGDFVPFSQDILRALRSLTLPACAISVGTCAVVTRYLKNALLDQKRMDYVRTARSKGLTPGAAFYRHILRNALLPTVTILGMMLSEVLGGSIIVENVFNLPGIGRLIISGIGNRDFPMVQGLVFYLAVTVVALNTLVDVIYTWIDPRIRIK